MKRRYSNAHRAPDALTPRGACSEVGASEAAPSQQFAVGWGSGAEWRGLAELSHSPVYEPFSCGRQVPCLGVDFSDNLGGAGGCARLPLSASGSGGL